MIQDKPLTEKDQKVFHPFRELELLVEEVMLRDKDLGVEMEFALGCLKEQIKSVICEN